MNICFCLYSEFPITPPLYYHIDWSFITHHKPSLFFLSVLTLKYLLHVLVLISYTTSTFLPTISICILVIVGFCYLEQYSMVTLGTSYDHLLSVQLILPLSIKFSVLPVTVFNSLYHTLYFYIPFERCRFSSQSLLSHTIFLFPVPVVLSVECIQFLSNPPEVVSNFHF